MGRSRARLIFCLAACLLTLCCASSKPKDARQYPIEGKVISLDPAKKEITLEHKDIPGYMRGMTMPFRVQDDWVFGVAQPGDELRGTLAVETDRSYIFGISINQGHASEAASSSSPVHIPAPGELAPDFSFVDQSGNRIRLRQFRGHPVLLTFIYTRCPLPDFCIRMSGNFAQLVRELKRSDPELYAKLRLLSISIDPEYDKPAVLKSYGKAYAGEIDPDFANWKFVSGSPAETRRAADFFGLSYLPEGGQIVHSLRTVLLAPDGKIAAQYPGNEWQPADFVAELQKLKRSARLQPQRKQPGSL
jgi:protein SCO1/2